MASVTSLDRDLRKIRLEKYTPAAANETRSWIEGILGKCLPSDDLLESLKDGVALCKLANLALPPPGIKFKSSAMPFVQMENISHFLHACKLSPLNLQEHDMFLTVDLYESKDPAQVLQCLGAFSRAANRANPTAFPTFIGPRATGLSPQRTGTGRTLSPTPTSGGRLHTMTSISNTLAAHSNRPPSSASQTGDCGSGRWSPKKSSLQSSPKSPSVTSWSSKTCEAVTSPAWNIAQYGYMGGASQGNLGISFGGRRQITSASPHVPSIIEKERRRKEKEAEEQRFRDEDEGRRQADAAAEEARVRLEEQRRWEAETRRLHEEEKWKADEERRRWEEQERQWKVTEDKRRKEEEAAEKRLAEERAKARRKSGDSRLQGQFLSQYQAEHGIGGNVGYSSRINELEKELELAREREAQYERERQERLRIRSGEVDFRACSRSRPRPVSGEPSRQDSWAAGDERPALQQSRNEHKQSSFSLHGHESPQVPLQPAPRPLPDLASAAAPPAKIKTHRTGESATRSRANTGGTRPLPDPKTYSSSPSLISSPRTSHSDRYFASKSGLAQPDSSPTYSREVGWTEERDGEDRRRAQSQQSTKAGGWASKSLLEREMEMERQRQREWEESQKETARVVSSGGGVDGIGGGMGGRWDVGQWAGYTGGDNQNRGSQGIGAGKRQIVGPRPLPGTPGIGH